ncbi:hypothetical protein [Paenibacillus fonticola]|uniref:hypothetical protein n=1 Tax=Paenibacillus fonticola TaxID=379896 RepID=UPI0003AACF08|nr:hypothetical protein [Paenibacillus fonticola]
MAENKLAMPYLGLKLLASCAPSQELPALAILIEARGLHKAACHQRRIACVDVL